MSGGRLRQDVVDRAGVALEQASEVAEQRLHRVAGVALDVREQHRVGIDHRGEEVGYIDSFREATKDANSDFNSNASYARFDVSSDNWSDVKSYFNDASSRIQSYWKDRYSPVDGACKRLALGEKHPDLEKALADLQSYPGNAKQTVTQLKKDYNAWLRDARAMREMTVQDHAELREVMCRTGGEYDMAQKVNELADRWTNQISNAYGTILGQSDRLGERGSVDKLKKYKGTREVLEGLRANRATLEKIKHSDLQGSNNPKIKAKLQYGIDEHARRQGSLCSSEYPEFQISSTDCRNTKRPGSGCRVDCVVPGNTCMIIEIKPDSEEAKREGEQQRADYKDGMERWYTRDKDGLFKMYPRIRECEHDGKLTIDTKPDIYNFCPTESEAKALGEQFDVSSDVSESE